MRILHAAKNVANQAGYVVRALRRMGHEAEVWEYDANAFGFPVDRTIDTRSGDPRIFWETFHEAADRFDVLHFHFGWSFFPESWGGVPPLWDLPVYRILGKKLFHTWHGADCAIARIHLASNPWSYFRSGAFAAEDDRTEKRIEVFRTYCDRMLVVSPDYLQFVPDAEVMPRVIDLAEWPEQEPVQREVPRILHVPSRRAKKGTDVIVAGLERLRETGTRFEFEMLENVPHAQVRGAIQDADIVIDNAITGDYELVSLEAMASGRVAVANIQAASAATFPEAPVWSVDPDSFAARMAELIADPALRRSLAERGRPYVARVHDAPVIAARLVALYERPARPVQARVFPDWLSLAPARRIERLEGQLADARATEMRLRRRLGDPLRPVDDRTLKERLPMPLRLSLRRARASLRRRLQAR